MQYIRVLDVDGNKKNKKTRKKVLTYHYQYGILDKRATHQTPFKIMSEVTIAKD